MSDSDFTTYSVLMSVYAADDPGDLMQSIDSILSQSFKTDDFVIVCDGPLTKELDEILNRAKRIGNVQFFAHFDSRIASR